jgi:hypothetical protein
MVLRFLGWPAARRGQRRRQTPLWPCQANRLAGAQMCRNPKKPSDAQWRPSLLAWRWHSPLASFANSVVPKNFCEVDALALAHHKWEHAYVHVHGNLLRPCCDVDSEHSTQHISTAVTCGLTHHAASSLNQIFYRKTWLNLARIPFHISVEWGYEESE